jgi:histidine triad (HIT) family protein
MDDCIFCRIIAGEIPSDKLYEDDLLIAFRDINPQAPIHFLVTPKAHIKSAAHISRENSKIIGGCFEVIASLAESEGLLDGFRVITNVGSDGGQTVDHIHFHVMGGAKFSEPMVSF